MSPSGCLRLPHPKVSVFKHLEVNVFPSVPYTLSINIRRDEAAALQQYFNLEVHEWPQYALSQLCSLYPPRELRTCRELCSCEEDELMSTRSPSSTS